MSAGLRIQLKGELLKEVKLDDSVYNASDLSSVCEGLKHLRKMNQEVMSKIVEDDKLKNGTPEKRCKFDDMSVEDEEEEED